MPQYNLNAKVTISLYTVVEADSLEEAIEIANERDVMAIIQDNSENENETWMADEIDGVPFEISLA